MREEAALSERFVFALHSASPVCVPAQIAAMMESRRADLR